MLFLSKGSIEILSTDGQMDNGRYFTVLLRCPPLNADSFFKKSIHDYLIKEHILPDSTTHKTAFHNATVGVFWTG